MRVAVSQFASSINTQENLATCIRMINEAAVCEPSLIVLPEFCNTLFCHAQPGYVDHNQAWNEALPANGTFLQRIAQQAKQHDCYIVLNVTLRRDLLRDHQDGTIQSNISVTSCLFSPSGDLIHQADKQTLTGYENNFFTSAKQVSEVITTPFGKLGLLTGSDSMTFEASRGLALHGAQLLCHSINSFVLDQSNLHGPARACENKVFLASANKVGSLVPPVKIQEALEEQPQEKSVIYSAEDLIPNEVLVGSGQSQIVSPNGKVLAKITINEEGFIFADIDLAECSINNKKLRPDGTDLIKQRRPELYQGLAASINQPLHLKKVPQHEDAHIQKNKVPVTANVAIFATYKSNEQAIEDVCHYIENNLSDIIQLPELFFIADKTILNNAEQIAAAACLSQQLINQVSPVLRPFQYVCTSLVIEGKHQAVLISEHGVFAVQQQLHFCQRYQWTALGNEVNIIELPLEQGNINVAMLTADDANIPEIVNVAALNDIHVLLVPFEIQEPCEVEYSLLSRATENRICIVAASREKSFVNDLPIDKDMKTKNKNKIKSQKSTGLIINLTTDCTLLSQLKSNKFTGYINPPLVKHQHGKITKAVIHPIAACKK
ncbi:nitrilase-related carbon-nitrogen hydrolase [Candidatus Colwellia aromaticivorans]|uniref:nitrilase-related carbon-nitrogen hydrolase n=1 Tax=Candidatus Colwellia aromaticivorans TaxID=2267621 RepID=UPI000DF20B69|nr:nitrilase-related carbon-nitrogen hydrolase [Candidatus Colwellia aromaticivorans]